MTFVAFFDGACEPRNPGGHMGFGAVIYRGPRGLETPRWIF
jgi:ribonuclease HI